MGSQPVGRLGGLKSVISLVHLYQWGSQLMLGGTPTQKSWEPLPLEASQGTLGFRRTPAENITIEMPSQPELLLIPLIVSNGKKI